VSPAHSRRAVEAEHAYAADLYADPGGDPAFNQRRLPL